MPFNKFKELHPRAQEEENPGPCESQRDKTDTQKLEQRNKEAASFLTEVESKEKENDDVDIT